MVIGAVLKAQAMAFIIFLFRLRRRFLTSPIEVVVASELKPEKYNYLRETRSEKTKQNYPEQQLR
jgi:hypothetical protein